MLAKSIKKYLRPTLLRGRRGTINSAFAAALAPNDDYNEAEVKRSLVKLGQDPERELKCAYCGKAAETWDHVVALVNKGEPAGSGHRIRNLLPCCATCNTKKGKKDWREHLKSLPLDGATFKKRKRQINAHINDCQRVTDKQWRKMPEYKKLTAMKKEILLLMDEADRLAERIRSKLKAQRAQKRRR